MAISFTRPDPSSPSSVASASFTTSRKGFETSEVREFLRMVAAELARLQERERFLERELRTAQRTSMPASVALDEDLVTKMLGEEAARILHTARDASSQIKIRSEESAARLLREATDEAQRVREEAEIEAARRRADATADAESEVEMAKQQGREMVNEARAYRERVLNELARRREIARQQIEQLVHGRDRLLQAFERSRLVAVDVMAELTPLGEPSEYVNLSPTTGPVPIMLPNTPRPGDGPGAGRDRSGPIPVPSVVPAADVDATIALAVSSMVPLVDEPAVAQPERPVGASLGVDDETRAGREVGPEDDAVGPMIVPHDPDVTIFVDDEFENDASSADADADADTDASDAALDPAPIESEELDEIDQVTELIDDIRSGDTDSDDTVVQLGAVQHVGDDGRDDDRAPAPVVSLFTTSEPEVADVVPDVADVVPDVEPETDAPTFDSEHPVLQAAEPTVAAEPTDAAEPDGVVEPDATVALSRSSADDLFARLRAARADAVAERATAAVTASAAAEAAAVAAAESEDAPVARVAEPVAVVVAEVAEAEHRSASLGEDSVFHATPDAPVVEAALGDTAFARRDEALTPLIVAAARKLKRVLADEQNEVLHALRRKEPIRELGAMVQPELEQAERYGASIAAELTAAAVAGAMSMGMGASVAAREVNKAGATVSAVNALVDEVVLPLRDRLARCVADADGDNQELASLVRLAYREWKGQRIDEHLDDVARAAFGRGALVGVAPGTPICWRVDPNGPECPDAEDNALAGSVPAGAMFPTDHPCAPAHSGCRCMIAPAD